MSAASIVAAGAVQTAAVWKRPSHQSLTIPVVQRLLPPGNSLHSLARLEMDGRPPQEVAAVASVPTYPGSSTSAYRAFVIGYDLWQRKFRPLYVQPLPALVPISVDAGRLIGGLDAAIFSAMGDDGKYSYRVVGRTGGSIRDLLERQVATRIAISEPLLIEGHAERRAWEWDGRAFRERLAPVASADVPRTETWRYWVRNGSVQTRAWVVHLYPRQRLRLVRLGGGAIPIVVPDPRLNLSENGAYWARHPGTYRIQLLLADSPSEAFVLSIIVDRPEIR